MATGISSKPAQIWCASIAFVVVLSGSSNCSAETDISGSYDAEIVSSASGAASGQSDLFALAQLGVTHQRKVNNVALELHASALWLHGNNFSSGLGDLNGVSNNAGVAAARLHHLTLELDFGATQIRAGRFVPDDDFMVFSSSDALLNSGFGTLATATTNMPLATYPLAALGALLTSQANAATTLSLAIFDGDVGLESNDLIGFETGNSGVGGILVMAELSHQFSVSNTPGRIILGGLLHSGDFARLDRSRRHNHNSLLYLGVERVLASDGIRSLTANARISGNPLSAVNAVDFQADTGLAVDNLFLVNGDRLSIGFIYLHSTKASGAADEWVGELNYRVQAWTKAYIQPGVQFVHNRDLVGDEHALVLMLRFGLEF